MSAKEETAIKITTSHKIFINYTTTLLTYCVNLYFCVVNSSTPIYLKKIIWNAFLLGIKKNSTRFFRHLEIASGT